MKALNKKQWRISLALAAALVISISALAYGKYWNSKSAYSFETAIVARGDMSNSITATGTLEATNTIIVGTQVSGVVEKIYVDFNAIVKKGQLLAELDKATLQASLDYARADLLKSQSEFEYHEANFKRMSELHQKDLISDSEFDLATYNYKKSLAMLQSSQANIKKAERNLSYASIYSPIDGVVLNRAVEVGQTVTASMNTPELFTIANDLSEMQVEANVDEADIGVVEKGQSVEFTVDAFPNDKFDGEIAEVRLQPTETSNVITYTVIVSAPNPELKLKPGMTASITAYVEKVSDVLILKGKALRFSPDRQVMMAYYQTLPEASRPQRAAGMKRNTENTYEQGSEKKEMDNKLKRIWVKNGDQIKAVNIETGMNDGVNIQVISGLNEGDEVITAMGSKKTAEKEEKSSNPFMPKRKSGK